MKYKKIPFLLLFFLLLFSRAQAQKTDFGNPTLTHYLNDDKTRFIQFSGYVEFWARYIQLNPGSLINSEHVDHVSDLSIRRIRAKVTMKPTEKLMLVLQMGPSNVNITTKQNTYMDLLDAHAEYQMNKYFNIGGGRSTWMGLSRFSTGPAATLLYDMPAFATGNAGLTDVTIRTLNLYAKGQIGKLDYRIVAANPYTDGPTAVKMGSAVFNTNSPHKLYSAYFKWQFLDKESNLTPFSPGTYLGKKSVFNLGIGGQFLKNALWHESNDGATHLDNMQNVAVDVFYDAPLNREKGTSVSWYAVALRNDYGPDYLRMVGTNNPASGVDAALASYNGAGNAYPLVGTGNTFYTQLGGTLPYFNKEQKRVQLLPAASVQYSRFDQLADPMIVYDAGVSLLLNGHSSKFTFDAQSRPIYSNPTTDQQASVTERKMTYLLKYRVDFN